MKNNSTNISDVFIFTFPNILMQVITYKYIQRVFNSIDTCMMCIVYVI